MARTIAADHDQKRSQILDTAARVFAEQGFHRASVSAVAAACGLSKAAIYHYYDSKDALLFDLLDNHLTDLRDRIAAVPDPGAGPQAHLRAVILEILLAYHGADDHHRVQIAEMRVLPEAQQRRLRDVQREIITQVSEVVRGVAPARFTGDAKRLRATTMSLFGMLNWFYMWNRDDSLDARHAYADLVGDLILNGITPGP